MNFKSIMGTVVSKGQSYFGKIPSEIESFKGTLSGLSIKTPDLGIDVNKLTSDITSGVNMDIDPEKLTNDAMSQIQPVDATSIMNEAMVGYQPMDVSSFESIPSDTISTVEIPSVDELTDLKNLNF